MAMIWKGWEGNGTGEIALFANGPIRAVVRDLDGDKVYWAISENGEEVASGDVPCSGDPDVCWDKAFEACHKMLRRFELHLPTGAFKQVQRWYKGLPRQEQMGEVL